MRVLHVQKVNGIGGSERHLLSLLPKLASSGVEVRMLVAATGRADDFTRRLRELDVPHSVLAAGPDVNPLFTAALLRELNGRRRPDLIHTHLIHADLHGQLAARLAGVPSVCSIHSTHGFYEREPYRSASRLAGRVPRLTIAISEHVRRFLERLRIGAPNRIRTVHYGIESSNWLPTPAEREAARAGLELESDDVAIGIASRLIPHKGHDLLLDAHAEASRQLPGLRLLVAGDGPLRGQLERRASELGGSVRFLGFVEDVRRFMRACDLLVFPSQPEFGEGFGLAALEALATGRPVIATAVASLPEVVVHEQTGLLVAPGKADELGRAMAKLAGSTSLRAEMGERAGYRARTTFSLESMVERTVSVYEEALGSLPG